MKLANEFPYLKWVENIKFIDKYQINFWNSYKALFSGNETVDLFYLSAKCRVIRKNYTEKE